MSNPSVSVIDQVVSDPSATAELTNPELTTLYLAVRREFRSLVERCVRISRGSAGIPSTGNRMYWASILFTRIVVTAKSISRLLPDPKPREHWDFSGVASLSRNLIEAVLVYHWLCGSRVLEEVRKGRFILLYLHDYGVRKRLFPETYPDDDSVYADLVHQFDEDPYLSTWDEKKRRVALRGEKTPFIQDDVLREMGIDLIWFRIVYRFFSEHTHTGPISFLRQDENDRGTGVETRSEKSYITSAVGVASVFLTHAGNEHLEIFPDAETRTPFLTDRDVARSVERNQGRSRK